MHSVNDPAEDFSLADLARITGAKRRTAQHWAASGVVLADPETERGGTGVHRRFSRDEVIIGCLVHAFSLELQISIGALLHISRALRRFMHESKIIFRKWIDEAIENKAPLYVMFYRVDDADKSESGFRVRAFQSGFPADATAEQLARIGKNTIGHLDTYGSFTAVVMANPYLARMR